MKTLQVSGLHKNKKKNIVFNYLVRFLKSTFSELGSHLRKVESLEGRVEVDANTAEKEGPQIKPLCIIAY